MMKNLGMIINNETICAIATRVGGALSVIRVSGAQAIECVDRIFMSASGKRLRDCGANTLHYGSVHEHGAHAGDEEDARSRSESSGRETIDDVVVSLWRAPHSYTGEDVVEISCHGSEYITRVILQNLIGAGCRQAGPGEFTMRAYLNGKMDLSQAEAVADLIASTNKATHDMAMSQLKGHFSHELSLLREKLLKMNSLLELELDFSDHEDLEFADRSELRDLAEEIKGKVMALVRSFEAGNALKEGVPVVIVGKTNVGKSTLLNRLLHEDKAIVSDVHGTTRDVIEDTTEISGITFRFIDTAGIRKTDDKVEKIGIERTFQKMDEAKIVVWLVDDCPSEEEALEMREKNREKQLLLVFNKSDTHSYNADVLSSGVVGTCPTALFISAKTGDNISELEEALVKAADIPEITENDIVVTSVRHYEALVRANEALTRVLNSLAMDLSGDLIAEDLKTVLDELGEITGGQISSQETLNNIFQHFCIGK